MERKYEYTFEQLDAKKDLNGVMFLPYELAQEYGGVRPDDYFVADSGAVYAEGPEKACEELFRLYNLQYRPNGYHGRSMSVSDIVQLWEAGSVGVIGSIWYCDSVGFTQINRRGERVRKKEEDNEQSEEGLYTS